MKHVDPMGGGYLRGMHINWGFLSGGLQFGGVISGGLFSAHLAWQTTLASEFCATCKAAYVPVRRVV